MAALAGALVYLAAVALARGHGGPATGRRVVPAGTAVADAPADVATAATVPRSADQVIVDAEYVYGPMLAGFDTGAELARLGGALSGYREAVGDESLTGAQVVDRVAREHSLSPRLLLALLEEATGSVTDPDAAARLAQPFGGALTGRGLNASLRAAAAWLDDGFYGLKYRDNTSVHFADGSVQPGPVTAGPGHFAVARVLALSCTPADWSARRARFADTYRLLWGDIPVTAAGPAPAPPDPPPLLLPWPEGESWYFTGGPHGAWGVATAWGAVDFAPPSPVGCGVAPEWAVAAAPGVVTRSERGFVVVDLDGDGFEGTGWVLVYLHMATEGRVPVGTRLEAGERVGHPSCEGGYSTGAHLHFVRRFNGEWLPADGGPAPLDLSGWRFQAGDREYDGAMTSSGQGTRNAVTSGRGGRADVVSDNGPARQAALAAAWRALAAPGADKPAVTAVAVDPSRLAVAREVTVVPVAGPAADGPAAAAQAPSAGEHGHGQLTVNLSLPERRSQATPFGVEITGATGQSVTVLGHVDGAGRGEVIALPDLPPGPHSLVVRVPGFQAQSLFDVPLDGPPTVVDLTSTLTPLLAGELTGDDHIDARDGLAWLALAARRRPAADVNGDGRVGPADLARLLGSWRR